MTWTVSSGDEMYAASMNHQRQVVAWLNVDAFEFGMVGMHVRGSLPEQWCRDLPPRIRIPHFRDLRVESIRRCCMMQDYPYWYEPGIEHDILWCNREMEKAEVDAVRA